MAPTAPVTPVTPTPSRRRSLATPDTPSTTSSNSSRTTYDGGSNDSSLVVSPNCFVALLEGRGSARGEVGIASICLNDPTLVLCQVADSRTYIRTLSKLVFFNPLEIIVPLGSGGGLCGDQGGTGISKLYQDIAKYCPGASVNRVQRKYFSDVKGLNMVRQLCAPEFAAVEVHLQHKFYRYLRDEIIYVLFHFK